MMKISCPSKTFLIGEYAVLNGGPAILIATPPRFILEDSQFNDPYKGAGGFGASSARFVLNAKNEGFTDPWKVLEKYRRSVSLGSGADVISQWMGGITYFYDKRKIIKNIAWPFENLYIALIHTGNKIQTLRHIQHLDQKNFDFLEIIAKETVQSLQDKNSENFLRSIEDYALQLYNLELTCKNTQLLLEKIRRRSQVLAAKGCGALGSDVILAVIEKNQKENFLNWGRQENLNVVFCDNQFAEGVS